MPSGTTPPAPPPRRSCFGCLTTGGLGCGAFLVGAIAAVVLFAPSLLGGLAAGVLESELSARIAGRVEVGDLELHWEEPQRARDVRLYDPEDELVADCELVLPSLLDLGDADLLREVRVTIERATLEHDAEGRLNLARALAPDPTFRQGDTRITIQVDGERGWFQTFAYRLRVDQIGENLLYRDARRPGSLVHIGGLELDVLHNGRGLLDVEGVAQLRAGGSRGQLAWTAHEQGARSGRAARRWGTVEGTALPAGWLDSLAGARGLLHESLGDDVRVALTWDGDPAGDVPVTGSLEAGEAGHLGLEAVLREGHLLADAGGLSGTLLAPATATGRLTGDLLPPGLTLERAGDRPWTVSAPAFDLALGAAPGAGAADCEVHLTPPADGTRLVDAEGAPWLLLTDVDWVLRVEEDGSRWTVSGALACPGPDGAPAGAPAPFEVRIGPDPALPDAIRVHCAGFPTAAVDRLHRTGGMLVRSLGPAIDLTLARPRGPGIARLTLDGGPGRRIAVEALEDDLQLEQGQVLELELPWSPELCEGLLDPLLPFLHWEGWTEADRVRLTVDRLVLPRDSDLAGVRAHLRLDPGRVPVTLAPGLAEEFDALGPATPASSRLLPVWLEVEAGRLTYHELVLPLGAGELELEGTLDLLRGELALQGAAPLQHLGARLPMLDGVPPGALAASGLEVDVELHGDPTDPRLLVDTDELGEMLDEVLRWVEQGASLLEGDGGDAGGDGDGGR